MSTCDEKQRHDHHRAGLSRATLAREPLLEWQPLRVTDHAPGGGLTGKTLHHLQGFGPASVADLAQFAIVHRTRVRAALRALADSVRTLEGPDGAEKYDVLV